MSWLVPTRPPFRVTEAVTREERGALLGSLWDNAQVASQSGFRVPWAARLLLTLSQRDTQSASTHPAQSRTVEKNSPQQVTL